MIKRIKWRPSFAFAVNDGQSIGFVGQTFNETTKAFDRNFTYIGVTIQLVSKSTNLHLEFAIRQKDKIKDQLTKLETIDNKIEMIGVFMNLNNETTVFSRSVDAINYCSVDEVNPFSIII